MRSNGLLIRICNCVRFESGSDFACEKRTVISIFFPRKSWFCVCATALVMNNATVRKCETARTCPVIYTNATIFHSRCIHSVVLAHTNARRDKDLCIPPKEKVPRCACFYSNRQTAARTFVKHSTNATAFAFT